MASKIQLNKIRDVFSSPWFEVLKWAWILLLCWVVIGGVIGELLLRAGYIEAYCDISGNSNIYDPCMSCKMHTSVFGVFETNNCSNALTKKIFEYGIEWPRTFVIALSLFVYPLVEMLYQFSRFLPALVLIPVSLAILIRTIFVNFVCRKDISKGVHRGLLASWLVLATISAVQW